MKIIQVIVLLVFTFVIGFASFAGDIPEIRDASELIAELEPIKDTTLPSHFRGELNKLIAQRDHVLKFARDGNKRLSGAIRVLRTKSSLLRKKTSGYIQEYQEKSEKINLSLKCDYRPRVPPIEILFGKEDQRMFEQMLIPLLNERLLPALKKDIPKAYSKYFRFQTEEIPDVEEKSTPIERATDQIKGQIPLWLTQGSTRLTDADINNIVGFASPEMSDSSKMPEGVRIAISGLEGEFEHLQKSSPAFQFMPDSDNPGALLVRVTMPSLRLSAEGDLDLVLMDEKDGVPRPMEGIEKRAAGKGKFRLSTGELPVSVRFRTNSPTVDAGAIEIDSVEIGWSHVVPDYSLELSNLPAFHLHVKGRDKATEINLAEDGVSEKVKNIINENWLDNIRPTLNAKVTQFATTYLKPVIDGLLSRKLSQQIPIRSSWPSAKSISSAKTGIAEGPFLIPYSRPTLFETRSGDLFSLEQAEFRVIEDSDAGPIVRLRSKIIREKGVAPGPDKTKPDESQLVTQNANDVFNNRFFDAISVQEQVCFTVIDDGTNGHGEDTLACSIYFQAGINQNSFENTDSILLPDSTIPASLITRDKLRGEGTLLYLPVRLANITLKEAWLGKLEPQWKREGVRRLYDALINDKPCNLDDMPQFSEWLWGVDRHVAILSNNICNGSVGQIGDGQRSRLIRSLFKELTPYRLVPTDFGIGDHTVRVMTPPVISVTNSDDSRSIDMTLRVFVSEVTSGSLIHGDLIDASLGVRLTPTQKGVMLTYINQSGEFAIYEPLLNLLLLGQLDSMLTGFLDRRLVEAIGGAKE